MGKTYRGSKSVGQDYGSKYDCNGNYRESATNGYGKQLAKKERRGNKNKIFLVEDENDYIFDDLPIEKESVS